MADQVLTLLRRQGIRPEQLESFNMQQSTRSDKVLFCRRFYKDSMVFKTIINRILDLVNVYGATYSGSEENQDRYAEFFYDILREYLLTGECLYYKPTDQILESERVEFEVDEDTGEVVRVLYDSEFEIDYDGIIGIYDGLRPSSVRGEPPFAITLPWIVQASSLMFSQIRAAEIGSRLLARIVTSGALNTEDPELQLGDDVYMLRTNNPQDSVDYPKYTPADFTGQMKALFRQIASACGFPYEVLFSDFTEANFSQSKAAFISARHEINRYRRMIERYANSVFGGVSIEWPEVEALDLLDQAKAASLLGRMDLVEST